MFWHFFRLKEEVQRLSDAVTTKLRRDDDAEDEEKRMYREQARALEEGKNIRKWEYKLAQKLW